jgi:hypothetical protein
LHKKILALTVSVVLFLGFLSSGISTIANAQFTTLESRILSSILGITEEVKGQTSQLSDVSGNILTDLKLKKKFYSIERAVTEVSSIEIMGFCDPDIPKDACAFNVESIQLIGTGFPVPVISIMVDGVRTDLTGKQISQPTNLLVDAGIGKIGVRKMVSIEFPDSFLFSGNVTITGEKPQGMSIELSFSNCLIATAAFGSYLTPQVEFLRHFRDHYILKTAAGSSFMNVFNAWYYSFSPYVASYERQQTWSQEVVKIAVYPLLGILHASQFAFTGVPGEYGALAAGLVASTMIGALYFWPFALSVKEVRRSGFNYRVAALTVASVATITMVSVLLGNLAFLMVSTSLFVLTLVSISAIISAKSVWRLVRYLHPGLRRTRIPT